MTFQHHSGMCWNWTGLSKKLENNGYIAIHQRNCDIFHRNMKIKVVFEVMYTGPSLWQICWKDRNTSFLEDCSKIILIIKIIVLTSSIFQAELIHGYAIGISLIIPFFHQLKYLFFSGICFLNDLGTVIREVWLFSSSELNNPGLF